MTVALAVRDQLIAETAAHTGPIRCEPELAQECCVIANCLDVGGSVHGQQPPRYPNAL
ncbi:hypothetical protein [Streptomyces sp. NBC_01431]|uniref:hypothetical protein n=1 Tax=Streptomyces sp. NBC_01431 TaxID=2903863 RepID=UPI002E37B840|nr:hypothetical protein [Streptomyces sp. NBC_01431]